MTSFSEMTCLVNFVLLSLSDIGNMSHIIFQNVKRLIFFFQPFWKVANNSYGKGRGVVGKKYLDVSSKKQDIS